METEGISERWGTWEELLLGGAVLRHGTGDWNLVAAELRARIVCPYICTPEICEAKYEILRKRYIGCLGWYEELRQQRIIELRQALHHSAHSIGSLESKLEALKSRKGDGCHLNSSTQSESWGALQKPNDELSAGSFTQQLIRTCSSNIPELPEQMAIKPERSLSPSPSPVAVTVRKRRGKRKRKDVKELGSSGENRLSERGNFGAVSVSKCENSWCNSFEVRGGCDANEAILREDGAEALTALLTSVSGNKSASVFRRRLHTQKRGRYKKIIRRHLDMDLIKSRIGSHSISSRRELYRDLLLLANNALIFYSRNTREHKSALLLRRLITATFHGNLATNTIIEHIHKASMDKPGSDNQLKKELGDVPTPNKGRRRKRTKAQSQSLKKGVVAAAAVAAGSTTTSTNRGPKKGATTARGSKKGNTK